MALPVYEYLGVDYGDPEFGGFSFHVNGWGRIDLGDQEYYQDDTEGYVMDGYVQYSNPEHGVDVKLGRHHIYAGIVNESVDGFGFKANAGSHVSLLAYGGYPVGYEDENGRTGDSTYGGRMAFEQLFPGEVGVSYKNLSNDNTTIENKLGADISLYLFDHIAFSGFLSGISRPKTGVSIPMQATCISASFHSKPATRCFSMQDYFSGDAESQTLGYLQDTDETLTIVGGDIIWQQFHGFDAG